MRAKTDSKLKKKKPINASLMIGILGVAATLIAAFVPVIFDSIRADPTSTLVPTATFTFTSTPTQIQTFTPLPPTFTPTPEPSTSTPTPIVGIYNVSLAMDEAGKFPTTVFAPLQYIFVFYSLNDPSALNQVKMIWRAADVAGLIPDAIIYVSEKTVTTPTVMLRARFEETWKVGKYRIEFYLNGVLDESIEFEVKE